MNKTKQQIIELIEPYMEKSLSEGCLLQNNNPIDPNCKIIGVESSYYEAIYDFGLTGIAHITDSEIKSHYKILGHYYITAVLKYIEDRRYN